MIGSKPISLLVAGLFVLSAGVLVTGLPSERGAYANPPADAERLMTSPSPGPAPSARGGVGAAPTYVLAGRLGQLPDNYFAYSPSEMRDAYNVTSLLQNGISGKGVTIAIVDAYGDPTIRSDLKQFDAEFDLPAPPRLGIACIDGPCNYSLGVATGWNAEIAIDVEWAHSIAPGANIDLYIGSNNLNALYDAELAAVEGASGTGPNGTGLGRLGVYTNNIISNSWTEPENDLLTSSSVPILPPSPISGSNYPWLDQVFQMAEKRGITVFVASGDNGAFDQGAYQTLPAGGAGYPTTDPFVTGVGGTSLYLRTTTGSLSIPPGNAVGTYGTETAWSWDNLEATDPGYLSGTGGGYSLLYPQPLYQRGLGVSQNAVRGVPDVAWDGDPYTGVIVDIGGVYYDYGGTSIGTPQWAATMALIDQKAGRSLGFMNPMFYSILENPGEYSKAFHDITVGNNDPYSATAGWDPLTGIGTPNVGELASIVAAQAPTLSVQVANNLNNRPVEPLTATPAFKVHETVVLTAIVDDHEQAFGSVTARILSQTGVPVVSNLPMTWDPGSRTYRGSYTIQSADSPGNWLAEVVVASGVQRAVGYNAFQVGGSIAIGSPVPGSDTGVTGSNFYEIGATIPLSMIAWGPDGTQRIVGGSGAAYEATFRLGGPNGRLEGVVPLVYERASKSWVGTYAIPRSVDQGAWIAVFDGVDGDGNPAVRAYAWVNVGLFVLPFTDTPSYVLGDTMTIFANTGVASGSFEGILSIGPSQLGTVPMSLVNASAGLWGGTFPLPSRGPTGFYTVAVRGDDGDGNIGSFSTVVRVAPYTMAAELSLSSKSVPLRGGHEFISAKITDRLDVTVRIADVEAYIYIQYENGSTFNLLANAINVQDGLPLTYSSTDGSFVGTVTTHGSPGAIVGNYTVEIIAYDPMGDFGTTVGSFTIEG